MTKTKCNSKLIGSSIGMLLACSAFIGNANAVTDPTSITAPGGSGWVNEDGHWKLKNIEYCSRQDTAGNLVEGPLGTLHVPGNFSPDSSYPVVVFFHGAGGNQNHSFPEILLADLAKQGFIGFSASYKEVTDFSAAFSPTKGVRKDFIQSAADGRCAIRWARGLAGGNNSLSINPDKIAVSGWSLGTMVTHNIALSPSDKVNLCINDGASSTAESVSSWRVFLHRALKHSISIPDNGSCTFEVSKTDADKVTNMIGATEAQWSDVPDGVQAFVPIATTSDLLNLSTECALMHSDFGTANAPALPLPVGANGEGKCQRNKNVQRAHQIVQPNTEQALQFINGDYFETGWRNIAESMMWRDDVDSETVMILDQEGTVPSGAETIVPYEKYIAPSTRAWLEKWSPIDALPPVSGAETDAVVAALAPVQPIPSLVIVGADDKATVWWEPVALGVRLRAAGFPAETVVVDGEGHSLGDIPAQRDALVAGFLSRVFENGSDEAMSWVQGLCDQHQLEGGRGINCTDDRSTVGKPYILPVRTVSNVSPPHHQNINGEFPDALAPVFNGAYDAQLGTYTLYSDMSYEFTALDFEATTTGYDNHSADIEWSVGGTTDPNDNETCTGAKIVVTVRAQLESKYANTCYFQLEPGTHYTLTATGHSQQAQASINVEPHPYNGVLSVSITKKSAMWGLVKWHDVRWGDLTGYGYPGGRVDIYIDGKSSPTSKANPSSVISFFGNRAKIKYKLCYTDTETCTVAYVN